MRVTEGANKAGFDEMSLRFCTERKQGSSKTVTGGVPAGNTRGMPALELLEPTVPYADSGRPPHTDEVKFQRSTEIVSREIAGETVVVPICRGVGDLDSIFTFNGMGSWLWSLLAEQRSEGELAELVAGRFAVERETARVDVQNFLVELCEAGLVRTA